MLLPNRNALATVSHTNDDNLLLYDNNVIIYNIYMLDRDVFRLMRFVRKQLLIYPRMYKTWFIDDVTLLIKYKLKPIRIIVATPKQ